jgi:hypothetical protein
MPRPEQLGVPGERADPGDGRVVPGIGEVPVECPHGTDEPFGVRGHRLGQVAAGRGDRADHGDRAAAAAERDHLAGPLVEPGQRAGQGGGVALLGGQRSAAGGQLAQRLRPPRCGVGDDHRVVAHVPVVLGDGHPGVDACLPGHHRHVGGVRDHHRAVQQPAAGPRVGQRAQLGDRVGHLVAALAAAHVDDHVRVAPLRQLLQQHRLAGAKAAGHRGGAPPGNREQCVDHPLPGQQRAARLPALGARPRLAHRPVHRHRDLLAGHRGDRLDLVDLAGRVHEVHPAAHAGWHQHPMLHRPGPRHGAQHITRRHLGADADRGLEPPAVTRVAADRAR